jgi:hypothetical protein
MVAVAGEDRRGGVSGGKYDIDMAAGLLMIVIVAA